MVSLYPRDLYLRLLAGAIEAGEFRFARQASLKLLADFPGDLEAGLFYARALLGEKNPRQAQTVLENLCQTDPEFKPAVMLLLQVEQQQSGRVRPETAGHAHALGGAAQGFPEWAEALRQIRRALKRGHVEQAEKQLPLALVAHQDSALVSLTHLLVLEANPHTPLAAKRQLGEFYQQRWPGCAQCMLLLAGWLMQGGEHERAVNLLHQATVLDVGGQTARRLWGEQHPYRSMWPEGIEVRLDRPAPGRVSAALGWNLLETGAAPAYAGPGGRGTSQLQGKTAAQAGPASSSIEAEAPAGSAAPAGCPWPGPQKPPPSPRPDLVQKCPDAEGEAGIALDEECVDELANAGISADQGAVDGSGSEITDQQTNQVSTLREKPKLKPVYVVFSTRCGLERQYGAEGWQAVYQAMIELAQALRGRPGWNALTYLADQVNSVSGWSSKPARPDDAWQLKLALLDLADFLESKGHRIGAVLIVGGPEVVPFHELPNPVDDDDPVVPSDSPYATRDENFFIPEWPVGRLPGGGGSDPELLIHKLRQMAAEHDQPATEQNWLRRLWDWLRSWAGRYLSGVNGFRRTSLAITASVWRKSAAAVFAPIGAQQAMYVSPPLDAALSEQELTRSALPLPGSRLAYFNLHGLSDSPEWFGQRDALEDAPGTDYPVALRPQDVPLDPKEAPEIVFSEACYGGHVAGKTGQVSLALRFLEAGTRALVASSCISYGSISTPLIAADLLGHAFWQGIKAGLPAGFALQEAKIRLTQEMNERQGYLDGEDQKTLISFVLYGDPLATYTAAASTAKEVMPASEAPVEVKTVCDRVEDVEVIPGEILTYVKRVVAQYLPGMEGAKVMISQEHARCDGEHKCPTSEIHGLRPPEQKPDRRLVMLSKQVSRGSYVYNQFARLTLDGRGKLVKLAVSR